MSPQLSALPRPSARPLLLAALLLAGCGDRDRFQLIEDPVPDSDTPPPLTEQDYTPTKTTTGAPKPKAGVYTDKGVAQDDQGIRGLVAFPIRDARALDATIARLYDPTAADFRHYLTPDEWNQRHAPPEADVNLVADWLRSQGMAVPRIAANRLLLEFTGTVGQFNAAFHAQLHVLERKSPRGGNDPHDVYGLEQGIEAPRFVAERIAAVVALDLPAEPGPIPGEFGQATNDGPPTPPDALVPAQVLAAYGGTALHSQGFRGKGVRLGVAIGAGFRMVDVRSFWQGFGIQRADPQVVEPMEPAATRYFEGTLDIEWSGAMAPEAELVVYQGPDARNTSMIYTLNEAIARGEVQVLTDSFAHREDSEARAVHEAYDRSATMAAALGITVVAASGDSAGVDVPGSSPHVTAVGGTRLEMNGLQFVQETAWELSGSGPSRTFARPVWQEQVPGSEKHRSVVDVSLNAETGYWTHYLGIWRPNTGTSYAAPIFAGLVAAADSARLASGKPAAGYLNPLLYTSPAIQGCFRDITEGGTADHDALRGWDFPSGWGAVQADQLAKTLP